MIRVFHVVMVLAILSACASAAPASGIPPGVHTRRATLSSPLPANLLYILNAEQFVATMPGSRGTLLTFSKYGFPVGTPIVGPADPEGVAVDASGKIYVVDTATDTLATYTPAGVPTSPTIHFEEGPFFTTSPVFTAHAVAVGANGEIYATISVKGYSCTAVDGTSQNCGYVLRYNADGTSGSFPTITGLNGNTGPTAVYVDALGKIYITTVWDCVTGHCGRLTAYLQNGARTAPTISGLKDPTGIAVDGFGKIHIVDGELGAMKSYNADGTPSSPTIPLPNGRYSVASDRAGKLYIANFSGSVRSYTPDGAPTTPSLDNLYEPLSIAVDASNKLYISRGDNVVTTYTSGGIRTAPTISSPFTAPTAIAVAPSRNIYIANADVFNSVRTINPDGTLGHPTIGYRDGINEPSGITVDSNGKIYVFNVGNSTVTTYVPNGNNVQAIRTPPTIALPADGRSGGDVAVDSAGKIYVVLTSSNRLITFSAQGWRTQPTITANLQLPIRVRVGSNGKIYVLNSAGGACPYRCGKITSYNSDGTPSAPTVTLNGGAAPTGLAIDSTGIIYVSRYANIVCGGYPCAGGIDEIRPDGSSISHPWNLPGPVSIDIK